MGQIRWGRILAVIIAIVIISRWEAVSAAIAELEIGQFWQAFAQTLRDIPPLGKYAVVLLVLALLYITLFRLILARRGQDRGQQNEPDKDKGPPRPRQSNQPPR